MNDLLLRACRRQAVPRPPVWIMRQAGRVLPGYRAVRERVDFLTLLSTPELAAEVTLEPVRTLGVDAAIIFSDILIVPQAMGMELTFAEGAGPRFPAPIRSRQVIDQLEPFDPEEAFRPVCQAIRLVRQALQEVERVPLVGFAGAPWTLAAYMVEGGGSKHHGIVKRFLAERPEEAHRLLDQLAGAVVDLLAAQIRAGAQVVQVFDSSAGALTPRDYRLFGVPYLARVVQAVKAAAPDTPIIVFARGAGWALEEIGRACGAHVLGVDWQTEAAVAKHRLDAIGVGMQGNLDPAWLYCPPAVIQERTQRMLEACAGPGYVANLGHGILPDTPLAHARTFVETVRAWGDAD